MGKTIAYARVSTNQQDLARQLDMLESYGYDKLIQEKFTGTTKKRDGLEELLKWAEPGDTIVVESISRLGRNTIDILQMVEDFDKRGINFVSLKEKIDGNTPSGKAMVGMFAVMAQLERDLLVQRVQEGLTASKKRGKVLGRPKADANKVEQALSMHDSGCYTVAEILRLTGISQGTLYRALSQRKDLELMEQATALEEEQEEQPQERGN